MPLSETLPLLLVVLAAAALPTVSRFLRLPNPVAEILMGVVLGRSLLNLHFGGEWLPFLAELGFLLLMFQAGMEIDFNMLKKQSRTDLFFHLFIFLATFAMSIGLSLYLGLGVFMALVLSTTSLGLVMPTLRETGISKTPLGQSILIAATLADFLTLLGITFYLLWHHYGLSWRFVTPLPLFLGFGVILRVVRLWAWWNPEKAERLLGPQDSQELGVRLSLALLFLFVAFSELVNLEPVLGAFMGGAVVSFVFREKENLENKLSALGFGFLIPIFFINVGIRFDLTSLFETGRILFALKLLVLAFAVKVIPAMLLVFRGVPAKTAFNVGLRLAPRLSLIVAAAAIGVTEGLITAPAKDAIVLLALLTCFLGPTLSKAGLKKVGTANKAG